MSVTKRVPGASSLTDLPKPLTGDLEQMEVDGSSPEVGTSQSLRCPPAFTNLRELHHKTRVAEQIYIVHEP